MSAQLSVIIPTLNAAEEIGPCLGALGDALFDGVIGEVIFADGGSSDATADVADETGARLIIAPRGRGSQLRAGAQAAHGPWYLFLHADCALCAGWVDAVREHIAVYPDRAGWFRLRFRSRHPMAPITAGWAVLRSRVFGLPYGDQGLLIRRDLYDAVGGHPPIPLMEDVAIARRIGRRLRGLEAVIETSAARYEQNGWLRQGSRNLVRLARYRLGADPGKLARDYARR